MSAIGTYEVLNRSDFQRCLDAARNIRTETSGTWLFKTTRTSGRPSSRNCGRRPHGSYPSSDKRADGPFTMIAKTAKLAKDDC